MRIPKCMRQLPWLLQWLTWPLGHWILIRDQWRRVPRSDYNLTDPRRHAWWALPWYEYNTARTEYWTAIKNSTPFYELPEED